MTDRRSDFDSSIFRDEFNKAFDDGMNFEDFYPSWRDTVFWEKWKKYARASFGTGVTSFP
jgi:hypothetical protein